MCVCYSPWSPWSGGSLAGLVIVSHYRVSSELIKIRSMGKAETSHALHTPISLFTHTHTHARTYVCRPGVTSFNMLIALVNVLLSCSDRPLVVHCSCNSRTVIVLFVCHSCGMEKPDHCRTKDDSYTNKPITT